MVLDRIFVAIIPQFDGLPHLCLAAPAFDGLYFGQLSEWSRRDHNPDGGATYAHLGRQEFGLHI